MFRRSIKLSLVLLFTISIQSVGLAGLGSKKAAYVGGTMAGFENAKKEVEGILDTTNNDRFVFVYKIDKQERRAVIPYASIIDLEYGNKAGRRVGTAVATTILLGPIGLLALFSKKKKHYLTIGYKDEAQKDQVAVFELGKDIVRTTLAIVETRSGKPLAQQAQPPKK